MKQAAAQTTRKRGNALSRPNKNVTSLSVSLRGGERFKKNLFMLSKFISVVKVNNL